MKKVEIVCKYNCELCSIEYGDEELIPLEICLRCGGLYVRVRRRRKK